MANDLTRQVLKKIREYIAAQKISMSEFGRQTGVSKAWLSKLKHTDANLSLDTATDLLHFMGYTLILVRDNQQSKEDDTVEASIIPSRLRKLARYRAPNVVFMDDFEDEEMLKTADTLITNPAAVGLQTQTVSTTPAIQQNNVGVKTTNQQIKINPGQTISVTAAVQDEEKNDCCDPMTKEITASLKRQVEKDISYDMLNNKDFFSTPFNKK